MNRGMSSSQILIENVIDQIRQDILEGDVTALEELLRLLVDEDKPNNRRNIEVLEGYLPEEL